VWLAARSLRTALAKRQLVRAELRNPDLVTTDLTGDFVVDVVARGKHLLIRLGSGRTLHNHLRMDGSWRVQPSHRAVVDPHDHVRVVLGNDDATALGYRVHDIALVPTNDEATLVGHLGPDLLGPDWDAAEAVRRLAADKDRSVGEALLDQRNLAGAGNVFKAEICFLRGLSPWTPMGDVGDMDGLVNLAHRLLVANRERHDHVTTGDSRPGRRTWVYGRDGKPCMRCGTTVRVEWQGDPARLSYWCPRCQPGSPTPPTGRAER
jgi:endonuclease-8